MNEMLFKFIITLVMITIRQFQNIIYKKIINYRFDLIYNVLVYLIFFILQIHYGYYALIIYITLL